MRRQGQPGKKKRLICISICSAECFTCFETSTCEPVQSCLQDVETVLAKIDNGQMKGVTACERKKERLANRPLFQFQFLFPSFLLKTAGLLDSYYLPQHFSKQQGKSIGGIMTIIKEEKERERRRKERAEHGKCQGVFHMAK